VVEIKPRTMTDDELADTVLQAMAYALLAQAAGHAIIDVAVYPARYSLVIRTPAQHLADDLAGAPAELVAVRAALTGHVPPWPPNSRTVHHQRLICADPLEPAAS
jgi:hypothetical protein